MSSFPCGLSLVLEGKETVTHKARPHAGNSAGRLLRTPVLWKQVPSPGDGSRRPAAPRATYICESWLWSLRELLFFQPSCPPPFA